MGASHPRPLLPERQSNTMDSTSFERLLNSNQPQDEMAETYAGEMRGSSPHGDISHTLESELELLANGLKRKRSDSREGRDGRGRTPPPSHLSEGRKRVDSVVGETFPAPRGVRERIVPIVGSSFEHPIELDDGTPEEAATDLPDPSARHEIIVIEDDEWSDVEDGTSSIPAVRNAAKKLRQAEQRGAAKARVPVLSRKRRATPAFRSQRGTIPVPPRQGVDYPELKIDDPDFLRAREHVERIIEYTFVRSELLREALYPCKHEPVTIGGKLVPSGNWRLALLGDTVLKTALIDSKILEMETLKETSDYAQHFGRNVVLAHIATHHDLQRYVGVISPTLSSRGRPSAHTLGTLVEAIIGAVWLDSDKDLRAVKRLLVALFGFLGPQQAHM